MANRSNTRRGAHAAGGNQGRRSNTPHQNQANTPQGYQGYVQPGDGYTQQGNRGYTPPQNPGYAQQPTGRYAPQGNNGYVNAHGINSADYSRANYGDYGYKYVPKKRHTGLKVFLVILVLLLILAGVAGFGGYKLYQSAQHVRAEAAEAMNDLGTVKSNLVSGDSTIALQSAQHLTKTAKDMKEETGGTLWLIAEKIPVVGEDISTVRTLCSVLEDVSENALEPLCGKMQGISMSALIGENNTINVDLLTQLVNTMAESAPVLQRSADAFNKCPDPHLDQLKPFIEKASTQLNTTNELFAFAYRFAPLAPDMLGANGARNYLIVAQNNVEVRSTGGFYGQVGMMTIDNGHFEVSNFESTWNSPYQKAYVNQGLANNYESVGIVGFPDPGLSDMGTNPDVPHVAQVLADSCVAANTTVSGVVIVDPIFIQNLTGLVGEFTTSDGTVLNGSNLAKVLMHDTYWNYMNNNDAQDVFFTMVANDAMSHIFASLSQVDMKALWSTLRTSAEARHFTMWLADPDEQASIAKLGFSGAVSSDPTTPVAGIYFTNESWSKMEWYLLAGKEITGSTANTDGSKTYDVKLTLTNTISDEEANSGNWYVTGGGPDGKVVGNKIMYQSGDMLERVLLCAPAGGSISDVWTDGAIYYSDEGDLYGLQTLRYGTHLLPGDSVTFTYKVTTSPQAKEDLKFDMTPLAQDAMSR